MELSINELADLTGKDRRTITKRLEKLVYRDGPKGAFLYESADALDAIYGRENAGKSLDDARRDLAVEQAGLARVKRETEEKKRPPLDLVLGLFDEVGQSVAAVLKSHKGKTLTEATINQIFGAFRELPGRLQW